MQTPTHGRRCGEAKDRSRARILPFAKAACKFNYCVVCDTPFIPRQSWHLHCGQCYHGARLYVAIVAYRGARS